jgi:DNA repair protein RadC
MPKTVTGAYECPDRSLHAPPPSAPEPSPYATLPRDEAEVEAGRALGPATTSRQVYDIVRKSLSKESQEVFLVLPLDLRGQCLSRPVEVARGQRDQVKVSPSDIYRAAIRPNCKGFVMVHVHPSGHCKPSPADRSLTHAIRKGTAVAFDGDVRFVDHVIVACSATRGEYFSFRDSPNPKKPKIVKVSH